MSDQTRTLKTACRCAQFCMLRMSLCVVSLLSLSTMVSMMLKVYLSFCTLLRSHLFVNCCIRRYSLYKADVCGFLKPPVSHRFWKVHEHGAFSIPRKTLGLRPNDQSCHHEIWLHLDFVDWSNTWSKQGVYEQRISLKERPADCSYGNSKKTY